MPITGAWYKAANSPLDATSPVGGGIDVTSPLTGYLSELFEQGVSNLLGQGDYVRYRKIFFKNEGGNSLSQAKAFFEVLQHIDQLKFAFEKSPGDSSANSETMPTGYVTGDFVGPVGYVEGTGIPGGIVTGGGGTLGFWLEQRIQPGLSLETGALGRIGLGGALL